MASLHVRVEALTKSKDRLGESKLYEWLTQRSDEIGTLTLYEEESSRLLLGLEVEIGSLAAAIGKVTAKLSEGLKETGYEFKGGLAVHAVEPLAQDDRAKRAWPRFEVEVDIRAPDIGQLDTGRLQALVGKQLIRMYGIEEGESASGALAVTFRGELCAADHLEARLDAERVVMAGLNELGSSDAEVEARAMEIGSGTDDEESTVFTRS